MANSSFDEKIFDNGRATVLRYLDAIFALGDGLELDVAEFLGLDHNQWAKSTDAVKYLLDNLEPLTGGEAERYIMLLERAKIDNYGQTRLAQLARWNICISVVGVFAKSRSYLPYVKEMKTLRDQYTNLIETATELNKDIKLPILKEVAQVQLYLDEEPAKLETRGMHVLKLVDQQKDLRRSVINGVRDLLCESYNLLSKEHRVFSASSYFGINIMDQDNESFSELLEIAIQLQRELLVPVPDPKARELMTNMDTEVIASQNMLERSVDVKGLSILWHTLNELNKEAEVNDETEVSAETPADEGTEENADDTNIDVDNTSD